MLRFIDYSGKRHSDRDGYSTKNADYDTKVLIIELEELTEKHLTCSVDLLRGLIKGDYLRIYSRLEAYLPLASERIRKRTFSVEGTGLLAVVHDIDRIGWLQKSSNIARFWYKDHDFNFVVRDKFYTEEHYILATGGQQKISTAAQLEASLLTCRILGSTHEAVFNRANPAYPGFHVQFIQRATLVWEKVWPIQRKLYSEEDLCALCETVYNRLQSVDDKTPCDLFFRWREPNYEIAVMPRKAVEEDSLLTQRVKKPFGGLEMVGFFPIGKEDTDRQKEVEEFINDPSTYIEALSAFAA